VKAIDCVEPLAGERNLVRRTVLDPSSSMLHPDGTQCLKGTSCVPNGYKPCCPRFGDHTVTCAHDVRFECWESGWVIRIADSAGGGGISIRFCPHCGAELSH